MKRSTRIVIHTLTLIVILMLVVIWTAPAHASTKVTFFVVSEHFQPNAPFNQYDHQFFGVEVDGWSASTYVNSYYKRSIMVGHTWYWPVSTDWELDILLGVVTGYHDTNGCPRICPTISPGVTYTGFESLRPRLGIAGAALTFSLSWEF